ncbi:MAG: hypothetical protein JSU86_07960 [Phycisphaerales bacterium]|nr:MAG: hypothetical protein JSU86_07960 [Phycisphaerales bacterium]
MPTRKSAVVPRERIAQHILLIRGQKELARKLDALQKKYAAQFKVVFEAIRRLTLPPAPKRKPVGYFTEKR